MHLVNSGNMVIGNDVIAEFNGTGPISHYTCFLNGRVFMERCECMTLPGAHEPPKVEKEHATCDSAQVPSKHELTALKLPYLDYVELM